jgi:hypothetical protein
MASANRFHPVRPLLYACWLFFTPPLNAARAQDEAATLAARIEAAQPASNNELDALDLPALMERLHVPAVSVAVIRDFKLHWAKAYGVVDAAWMTGHLRKSYGMVIMANGDNGMALLIQLADRIVHAYGWDTESRPP